MFTNYIKITLRNLWKNKGYSFLNIAGLAIGIACAALIFLWVEDELDYNHYFSNRDNLYKVKDHQTYDGTTFTFDATPGPLAAGMKAEIPGIKNTARTTWGSKELFTLHDKAIYEQGMYADSPFLSMFQLQFIKGNAANAFSQLHSLVISEAMANRFFETTDVIGKTLKVNNNQNFVISGVIKDLPKNVSFRFDWLAPFTINEDKNTWLKDWGNNGILTYAELEPNASINAINKKMDGYIQSKQEGAAAKTFIYPMNRWRLYDSFDNGKENEGRIKYVKLFSLIAWIILIIACINFMNLATARSEKRAREVGVRKVLGAGKSKLIGQFIGESLMMAALSAIVAIASVYLLLPSFNYLVDKELSFNLFTIKHLAGLLMITLTCGLLAGSYPAFYLSSFNPVGVLKGLKLKSNANAGFIRKGLVILQFTVSVILIISTVIVYQQIQHVKERDLGYNKQNLLYMNITGNIKTHFDVLKNELKKTGFVENAALSRSMTLLLGSNTGGFDWEGKDPNKQILITVESATPDYVQTMGMTIKEGRDFYPEMKSDTGNVIINESFAKLLKKKTAVGSVLTLGSDKFSVVGVIHDFIFNNLYAAGTPLLLYGDTATTNYLSIRIKSTASLTSALPAIEKVIKTENPGYPVEYKFVDATFENLFKTETLIGTLAGVFAVLAIVISCLGLFGLAAYTAERRTKEIGIRKVLGASTQGLASLLSKDFLLLITISCLIAFPLAWWVMHSWLQSYEYRITISWWIFIAAGLLSVFIALLTVSFQAIKAALMNPVKSLRSE
jgi:predicted permease